MYDIGRILLGASSEFGCSINGTDSLHERDLSRSRMAAGILTLWVPALCLLLATGGSRGLRACSE